ncbi:MAG: hypothetical protein LBT86_10405 [Deltaproteobacteria bacterium]|jgi:hypothetical protein|nr:hypothetical protein [Deltaproteobacteria bacterium]
MAPSKENSSGLVKNFFVTQFSMFVLSLVLAFILWLTVSGQDTTVYDLTATLELTNQPPNTEVENKTLAINIRVEANKAHSRLLEVNKYFYRQNLANIEPGPHTVAVNIANLSPTLPRGVKVTRFDPMDFTFHVYPYETKEVPVTVELVGQAPNYLEITGPAIIEPKVARITGPTNHLEVINSLSLGTARLSEIRGPDTILTLSSTSAPIDRNVTVEPKVFRARVASVLKEESEVFVNPVLLDTPIWNGAPTPLSFRPGVAKVKVSWTLDHPAPKSEDIKLTVRLTQEDLAHPGNLRLPINPTGPNWVKIVKVEPSHLVISKVRRPDILKP